MSHVRIAPVELVENALISLKKSVNDVRVYIQERGRQALLLRRSCVQKTGRK